MTIPNNMTREQINVRLAEIYQTLNKLQEMADAVMYNQNLDSVIKGVLLDWYESKLNCLKNELWEYTDAILNNG